MGKVGYLTLPIFINNGL